LSNTSKPDWSILKGTTLRVYLFLFKAGLPSGPREVQRGLSLSSPSVADYHLKKLIEAGLIKEEEGGYVVDRVVWSNMIRIKRTIIPLQAFYSLFFAAALIVMIIVFRNAPDTGFVFGLLVIGCGLGLSLYETVKAQENLVQSG
jgi:DNA-binding transcriptional ArsR family regulator